MGVLFEFPAAPGFRRGQGLSVFRSKDRRPTLAPFLPKTWLSPCLRWGVPGHVLPAQVTVTVALTVASILGGRLLFWDHVPSFLTLRVQWLCVAMRLQRHNDRSGARCDLKDTASANRVQEK